MLLRQQNQLIYTCLYIFMQANLTWTAIAAMEIRMYLPFYECIFLCEKLLAFSPLLFDSIRTYTAHYRVGTPWRGLLVTFQYEMTIFICIFFGEKLQK